MHFRLLFWWKGLIKDKRLLRVREDFQPSLVQDFKKTFQSWKLYIFPHFPSRIKANLSFCHIAPVNLRGDSGLFVFLRSSLDVNTHSAMATDSLSVWSRAALGSMTAWEIHHTCCTCCGAVFVCATRSCLTRDSDQFHTSKVNVGLKGQVKIGRASQLDSFNSHLPDLICVRGCSELTECLF